MAGNKPDYACLVGAGAETVGSNAETTETATVGQGGTTKVVETKGDEGMVFSNLTAGTKSAMVPVSKYVAGVAADNADQPGIVDVATVGSHDPGPGQKAAALLETYKANIEKRGGCMQP